MISFFFLSSITLTTLSLASQKYKQVKGEAITLLCMRCQCSVISFTHNADCTTVQLKETPDHHFLEDLVLIFWTVSGLKNSIRHFTNRN